MTVQLPYNLGWYPSEVMVNVMNVNCYRYLQTLNSISAENNSTIVFPVPIDIISQLISNDPISAEESPKPSQTQSQSTLITIEEISKHKSPMK